MQLGAFIGRGAAGSPVDRALACLLGLLGQGVSEACGINIEDLGIERGHRTVTVLGQGSGPRIELALIHLPSRVARSTPALSARRRQVRPRRLIPSDVGCVRRSPAGRAPRSVGHWIVQCGGSLCCVGLGVPAEPIGDLWIGVSGNLPITS
jgi:integrase